MDDDQEPINTKEKKKTATTKITKQEERPTKKVLYFAALWCERWKRKEIVYPMPRTESEFM